MYNMHVASFARGTSRSDDGLGWQVEFGTFASALKELNYLKELGVNVIRVMGTAPAMCDGSTIDVKCWSM